jgi:undecaprenyl-diphosphatase
VTAAVRLVRALDGHDRGLLHRWVLRDSHSVRRRRGWIAITHAGGAVVTIASVLLPLLTGIWSRAVSAQAALALTLSHLVVQAIKRSVNRERPATTPLIPCPDRFSFPSGHATAALAVALSYGLAFPGWAPFLVAAALVVGWSRVVLGVHYPGDVVMGQGIALATVVALGVLG